MNKRAVSTRPVRKQLDHSIHFHGRFGATYFITICCQRRGWNQLCKPEAAQLVAETARQYHASQQWFLKLLLLMPDHLHMLVSLPPEENVSKPIRDFKRICARKGIEWQRNFFDHRLRHDESESEKFDYICQNPVRAGLAREADDWSYVFVGE
jgi:putative transposase